MQSNSRKYDRYANDAAAAGGRGLGYRSECGLACETLVLLAFQSSGRVDSSKPSRSERDGWPARG